MARAEKRRYRKVLCRMYGDDKFLQLSRPQPNGQSLWLYLLTGPHTSAIPGLFVAGQAALAESLGWSVPALRRCWTEIQSLGMADADWERRVVWLPNALDHNAPENPNVVNAWRKAMHEIPECDIKAEAERFIEDYLQARGREWLEAWHIDEPDQFDARLRRALRQNASLRAQIKDRDQDLCRYCGRMVSWTDRRGPLSGTYDHVQPAGLTTLENIVTACRSCNSTKRHRTPLQARMMLLDPGTNLGPNLVPSANQEQEQEQEQEDSPLTPHADARGASVRVTRAFRKRAEEILRIRFGRCQHDPRCANHEACVMATARDLIERGQQTA